MTETSELHRMGMMMTTRILWDVEVVSRRVAFAGGRMGGQGHWISRYDTKLLVITLMCYGHSISSLSLILPTNTTVVSREWNRCQRDLCRYGNKYCGIPMGMETGVVGFPQEWRQMWESRRDGHGWQQESCRLYKNCRSKDT